MKRKTVNVGRIMSVALLGALLLFNILTVVFTAAGLSVTLNWLPGAFLTVETGSMEPELYEGDLIFVWRVPFETLETGDTVTYYEDGNFTTHKISRITEEGIITRGLVNKVEDGIKTESEYTAKMLFSIRGGGKIYKALTSGWMLALCAFLIAALFLAKPLVKFISGQRRKIRIGAVRITAALCAFSCLLLPKTMTLAKYTGVMASGTPTVAAEINFESNYLSREGNYYEIIGWDGSSYTILLKISNFSNSLKGNAEDVELNYDLTVQRIESDGIRQYSTKYDLNIEELNGNSVTSSGITLTNPPSGKNLRKTQINSSISHSVVLGYTSDTMTIKGGALTSQYFQIVVDALDENNLPTLQGGDTVMFSIMASSLPGQSYSDEIFATFSFTYSSDIEFLKYYSVEQKAGASLVKLTLKSATLPDEDEREIVILWDKSLIYPNTFETKLWNLLDNGMCVMDDEKGTLTFNMPATASMTFQFNKYTAKLDSNVSCNIKVTSTAIAGSQVGSSAYKEQIYVTLSTAIAGQ